MEEVEDKHGSIVIICEMSLPTIFNCKQFSIRKRRIFEYIKPTSTHNNAHSIVIQQLAIEAHSSANSSSSIQSLKHSNQASPSP